MGQVNQPYLKLLSIFFIMIDSYPKILQLHPLVANVKLIFYNLSRITIIENIRQQISLYH